MFTIGFTLCGVNGLVLLARKAVYSSDVALDSEQYAALAPQSGTTICQGGLPVDRLLSLLAQTMDDLYQPSTHFEHTPSFFRNAGYSHELVWICCDYDAMLLQRNEPGDHLLIGRVASHLHGAGDAGLDGAGAIQA